MDTSPRRGCICRAANELYTGGSVAADLLPVRIVLCRLRIISHRFSLNSLGIHGMDRRRCRNSRIRQCNRIAVQPDCRYQTAQRSRN